MTSKKPNLGFLIPEFPQQTHIAWWRVANEMRNLGYNVQLISTTRPGTAVRVHDQLNSEIDGVLYLWPPSASSIPMLLSDPSKVFTGISYLRKLEDSTALEKLFLAPLILVAMTLARYCKKNDIEKVFVHSCANSAHILAMANRMTGLEYALRLGGDLHVYGKDHFNKMAHAKLIVSASPTYFEDLEKKARVPKEKLMWTWVGTDLSRFERAPNWPNLAVPGKLKLITVARLNATKGHLHVLEAVRRLLSDGIDITYTIVGAGPHEGALREYVEKSGLSGSVDLLGAKDAEEVARLLQAADLHVLASYGAGEAAPAAVCEAMASGLPALCTSIGATPLMIDDGIDGFLVAQKSPEEIYEKLLKLHREPELLVRMKQNALEKSFQFDSREVARRIIERFEA